MDNGTTMEAFLEDEDDGRNGLATGATSDYAASLSEASFCSVSSSVNGHVWEYGRRYQIFRYGRYPVPNDDEEFKREALKHAMLKELLHGKLYLAPIGDHPQKIIDLGTGFGDWAPQLSEDPIGWLGLFWELRPVAGAVSGAVQELSRVQFPRAGRTVSAARQRQAGSQAGR